MKIKVEPRGGEWVAWIGEIKPGTLEPVDPECDIVETAKDACEAIQFLAEALDAHENRQFILLGIRGDGD